MAINPGRPKNVPSHRRNHPIVSVRIGRSYSFGQGEKSFDASLNNFAEYLERVLSVAGRRLTVEQIARHHDGGQLLQAAVNTAAEISINNVMMNATTSLMGSKSPPQGETATFGIGTFGTDKKPAPRLGNVKSEKFRQTSSGLIRWPALAQATVNMKGNRKFFVDSGDLRQTLRRNAGLLMSQTGGIQVKIRKPKPETQREKERYWLLASLQLRIAPRITSRQLPALAAYKPGSSSAPAWTDFDPTMSFEQKLGLPRDIMEKLTGPTNKSDGSHFNNRPLLQPVFSYWLLFRLPAVLQYAIDDVINTLVQR